MIKKENCCGSFPYIWEKVKITDIIGMSLNY